MERFNLDTWLEDKSRKVIDDDGFPVEIIKWDANEKYPVVLLNHNGIAYNVSVDGMYDDDQNHGLFFADDEKDEFETTMISFSHAMFDHLLNTTVKVDVKEWKNKLLDLARNVTYNPYKATVESISEMVEKYEQYCRFDIDGNLSDFLNNVKVKCKDAMKYDKLFPHEEFIPKKQYEEDLGKAYKTADKVQFNCGMSEALNNPHKYFHVGDTIRLKNSTAEHTITSIFNGKYYGEGWSLDIIKAADDYELANTFSKQDEEMLNEIIDELTPYGECPDYPSERDKEYYYKRNDMIDWLKEKF